MNKKIKNINYTYLFILSTVSFLWFIFKEHTAYDWPAIDMMPFFERYYDSSFLINDFFTNSISNDPNPRWSFGYFIIGLAELFNVNWYTVSYSVKVILVVTTPILFYLVMYLFIGKFIDNKQLKQIQIILLIAILIVIYPRFSGIFSIAWWKPYFVQSAPQNVSLFFGLLAIVIKEITLFPKYDNYIYLLLFFISTLIHPVIGLFIITFYFIVNYQLIIKSYKQFLNIFIVGFSIPVVFIKVAYAPDLLLDTLDFVNIYTIENHSSHYHLANFGTHTPVSWIYSFLLMLILLTIPMIYFYAKDMKKVLLLSSLFLLSYILAVAFQYIFIDIFPSKVIAYIGPVRFTQFTYWMIVILWSIMLSRLWFLDKLNFNFNFKKSYLLIWGGYIIMGINLIDSPKDNLILKDKEMYQFIKSTNMDSVFASNHGKHVLDIPNIGQRAVFSGNGFPFNESHFKEYQNRKALLYGNIEQLNRIKGKWIGEKIAKFFRQKTPSDFIDISKKYKLDYVVIEKSFSNNFKDFNPKFENKNLKIYKVSDLRGEK